MDEELRALEQRWRASPADVEAAVRFGLALARTGARGGAARVLAAAVDHAPGNESALRALDSVAPGGFDPESPWPTGRGHLGGAGRARAEGPAALRIVAQRTLEYEIDLRYDLVTRGGGAIVATNPRGERPAPRPGRARPAVELDFEMGELSVRPEPEDSPRLVTVGLDGSVALVPGRVRGGSPTLLADWTVLAAVDHRERRTLHWAGERGQGSLAAPGAWVVGLGHVVVARGDQVEAVPLADSARDGPEVDMPGGVGGLVIGPRATVFVHGNNGLTSLDLATGERGPLLSLPPTAATSVFVGASGHAFLGRTGLLVAVAGGAILWQQEPRTPVALAGAREEILLAFDPASDPEALLGLEPDTGREVWRTPAAHLRGRPAVDTAGRIYWRQGEALVLMESATGRIVSEVEVGGGWRDFVLMGERRIAILRRVGVTRTQLVVVGE